MIYSKSFIDDKRLRTHLTYFSFRKDKQLRKKMNSIGDGWFSEVNDQLWRGQAMSLKITSLLHEEKSTLQRIAVFNSETYGRMLTLDNAIQLTERDEFAYHEMLAHATMLSHPNPKQVLIVGGGDGGVAREVLKHTSVDELTLCEIDERVVAVSKEFFPSIASSFADPRMQVLYEDGAKFLEGCAERFDVIITDSSDPIGPAETLYGSDYYKALKGALRPGGIICQQAECMWLHLPFIRGILGKAAAVFSSATYGYLCIPTYPSGQIGFLLACKDKVIDFSEPCRALSRADNDRMQLKYYNASIHRAAFALPEFAKKALDGAQAPAVETL